MPGDRGRRGRFSLQVALFSVAALAILAGSSFAVQGHSGESGLAAMFGGILCLLAGVLYRRPRVGPPLGVVGFFLTLAAVHFRVTPTVGVNLSGQACLVLGGLVGAIGYADVIGQLKRRVHDLERLNGRLEEQRRVFLAATEEPIGPGGSQSIAFNFARQTGARFCCLYLLSADGARFEPQVPAPGLERCRAQPLARQAADQDPILVAVESGQDLHVTGRSALAPLFSYLPSDFGIENALVVPIPVGGRPGGFFLLGNRPGGFGPDLRRLASSLAVRIGVALGSAHDVARSRAEANRYALLNEIIRQSSGRSMEEVLQLVLDRAGNLVPHDSARVVIFESGGAWWTLGAAGAVPQPVAGTPLEAVWRDGRAVLRKVVTAGSGLYSGIVPAGDGAQVSEVLVPIRGRAGVFAALCMGRRSALAFGDRDIPAVEELGSMAGIAVDNTRQLEQATGKATQLDTALGALEEVAQALTTVTQGRETLERKTLETAVRLMSGSHGLITRSREDAQVVTSSVGFRQDLAGSEFRNGQGLVGAVMLSGRFVDIADAADSFDLASPPDLAGEDIRGAICVPMMDDSGLRGTLSVFSGDRREWSDDDVRVLSTLGSQAAVAVQNAELYDSSRRMIWELGNLHDGLKAVTATLELEQVLELVLSWAAKASHAQIGCLALVDGDRIRLAASHGTDAETAGRLALGIGGHICRRVLAENRPFLQNSTGRPGEREAQLNPRSVLCVPLPIRGEPMGVLFLANYVRGRTFHADHRRLVTALASQCAVAIENARLFRGREEVMLSALNTLAALVDARDPYTAGHSNRVTEYSLVIARELDYAAGDEVAWRRLRQGGLLHDIGKIAVPDAILTKPGRLTDEEFDVMKAHPARGYDILKNLPLHEELVIVRSHHERFDGRGYPDRKRGDELPLVAWMVSAADALDAMTSDRPYRRGMSFEAALGELTKHRGTQFSPEVVDAIIRSAKSGALALLEQESRYLEAPVLGAFQNPVAS